MCLQKHKHPDFEKAKLDLLKTDLQRSKKDRFKIKAPRIKKRMM